MSWHGMAWRGQRDPTWTDGFRYSNYVGKKSLKMLRSAALAVLSDLDLYALLVAGFVFTILGASGIADVKTLSSVILALLAIMAFSQIRLRRAWRNTVKNPLAEAFSADFPPDLYAHRDSAVREWLYIGISGYRTIGAGRLALRRMLERNNEVRIVLLDHTDAGLLEQAARRGAPGTQSSRVRDRLLNSLTELSDLKADFPEHLEVRLAPFLTTVGVNAFDPYHAGGAVYVQHYEFGASAEASPIYRLLPSDGYWYQHQMAEFERMWDASRPM